MIHILPQATLKNKNTRHTRVHNCASGTRGFECKKDGRLFFKVVKILRKKKPKAFFLENVKHLKFHANGETYSIICRNLENTGYEISSDLIDSRRLVPQHRERIYIVGFRKDLVIKFEFPEIPDSAPRLRDILQYDTDPKYTLSDRLWNYLRTYAKRQRSKGNGFGYGLANPDDIARTLSARYHKDGAEILVPQKRRNPRRLTPRECARLMGFPSTFVIPVSDTQAYKQFGNSVVVPIVERIAQQMANYLSVRAQIPAPEVICN